MKYKSVWNSNDQEKEKENQNKYNEWIPLPNNFKFGEKQKLYLLGARALIGGSKQHLLFITYRPKNIDVIDLNSFEYLTDNLKNNILPVSNGNVDFHCFVSLNLSKKKNGNGLNEFLLMSKGETLIIRCDEISKEFSYQILPFFKNCHSYAYACWNHKQIFIFGGYVNGNGMDGIWKLDIKKKEKTWEKCDFKIPFAIQDSVAVVSESDSSIHVIGGINDNGERQSTHYVMKLLTIEEIAMIAEYWMRQEKKSKKGWIIEFDEMIEEYIN